MLRKLWKLEASDNYTLLILAGLFLAAQLINGGILLFTDLTTGVLVCPLLLLVVAVLLSLLLIASHGVLSFEQAVRMGMTRRTALRLFLGLSMAQTVALFATGAVLVVLEQLLGRYVWPLLSPGVELKNFLTVVPWWGYLLALGGCLVAGVVAGAGIQRYGAKFGWGVWVLWMGWFFLYDQLPWKRWAQSLLWPAVAVLVAALLIWSIWSYLHAVIRK